uniref:GH10 domain-containing protein n=1 Tax=Biomphalaria glabrata TaxID=6526 RepID=A0A2C9LDU7_BIOGL
MWVTELDLSAHDENTRADWYETALRLYFSHPSIEGIIFWGFWDHHMDSNMALVHGSTFELDKAGERYLQLTKQEWSTHVNKSLSAGTSFDVRGFQGDYDVIVWYQNKPIKIQSFSLGKSDVTVNVDISGNEPINGVDTCVAVNGYERFGREEGVRAYAACCSA